jgi:hypothetical protein
MCWCDMLLVCGVPINLYVSKWHVDSRARLVLVRGSSRAPPSPAVSTSTSTSTSPSSCHLVPMATSMDVDGTTLAQPATLHGAPQVREQPITHTTLPLSNGRLPIPISARFGDCSGRLDPYHYSGSQNREPFREIPVKVHIRRPERDSWVYVGRATVSLDTAGHSSQVGESPYTHTFVTLDRSSETLVRSCPLDSNG